VSVCILTYVSSAKCSKNYTSDSLSVTLYNLTKKDAYGRANGSPKTK